MMGGATMVATRKDAVSLIDTMSDSDFAQLCIFLNNTIAKTDKRKNAENKFISEVKAAEESVANGNYVTLEELHKFLGV